MKSGALVFLGLAIATVLAYWLWGAPKSGDYKDQGAETSAAVSPSPEATPVEESEAKTAVPTPSEAGAKTYKFPGILPAAEIQNKIAVIKTAKGEIKFEILAGEGPKAASNFVYLAKEGFYDGLSFHRVEDWVIQGGDPNCGSTSSPPTATGRCGTGGPGYRFEDETVKLAYQRGIVAMANAGPNTNGSQFFMLKKDTPLQPNYTIFGRVVSGMDVVDKILSGDAMTKIEIVASQPR